MGATLNIHIVEAQKHKIHKGNKVCKKGKAKMTNIMSNVNDSKNQIIIGVMQTSIKVVEHVALTDLVTCG